MFVFEANSIMWMIMQNFGGKKRKIAILGKKLIPNENFERVLIVHVICIMTVAEKQQNILNLLGIGVVTKF